ncbi:hypothetical protein BD626DRAFT_482738 [Schizophyllum amplum]|uniref:Uncharacterized protein n=1 Tax=Schizophyllum amplum TaxID=97359 RepID=A0A550CNU2_9AGAR|nr:hypothetical protein BD626DRAFT_482738 [Auriculariopsis ampla]
MTHHPRPAVVLLLRRRLLASTSSPKLLSTFTLPSSFSSLVPAVIALAPRSSYSPPPTRRSAGMGGTDGSAVGVIRDDGSNSRR